MWEPEEQERYETAVVRAMTDANARVTRLQALALCSVIGTSRLVAAAQRLADSGVFPAHEIDAIAVAASPLRGGDEPRGLEDPAERERLHARRGRIGVGHRPYDGGLEALLLLGLPHAEPQVERAGQLSDIDHAPTKSTARATVTMRLL